MKSAVWRARDLAGLRDGTISAGTGDPGGWAISSPRMACALTALLAIAGVACQSNSAPGSGSPEGEFLVPREVFDRGEASLDEVKERPIPQLVRAGGRVAFDDLRVTHVFSPVTGRITRVFAKPGDHLRKNAPLVAILSPDVGSAFSDVVKAHADLAALEAEFQRQTKLAAVHAGTQRDLEAAQDNYEKARAEYERARQKAALLRSGSLDSVTQEYTLRSFIDGEVVARSVSPGIEVQGQYSGGSAVELFTIGSLEQVWVFADLPQADLPRVSVGADLLVEPVAYPDRSFVGKVEWIAPVLDPTTRTARLRATVANSEHLLKPEMFVSVAIASEPRLLLSVPRAAVVPIGEQSFTWVASGERNGKTILQRRLIRVGRGEGGDYLPVLAGLAPGERVLVERKVRAEKSEGEVRLSAGQMRAAEIEVAPVARQDVDEAVTVGGRFSFDDLRVAHVFPPVTGRITRVLANPGEHVAKGTPLAVIQSPDMGIALSDVGKAQADLTAAAHEHKRQKELFEAHASAERDLEAAEGNWRKAEAEFERARQKARLFERGDFDGVTQEYLLRSPIDGLIVARNASPGVEVQGQYSGASNVVELFTIGDARRLWVLADVFESDLGLVRTGLPVTVRLAADPEHALQGSIDWVASVLDPVMRTAKVRCVVDNSSGKLKPEMYEAATISIPARQQTVVPRRALLRVGEDTVVFVAAGDGSDGTQVFKMRRVVARDEKAGALVPIVSGLAPGERVVVRGAVFVLGQLSIGEG